MGWEMVNSCPMLVGAQSLVFSLERAGECQGAHRLSSGCWLLLHLARNSGRCDSALQCICPTPRSGEGEKTLSAPSRQLARALKVCDLIKIIVFMQNHKCQEDTEGCASLFTAAGPDTVGQTSQPFSPSPACSRMWNLLQKLGFLLFVRFFFFLF